MTFYAEPVRVVLGFVDGEVTRSIVMPRSQAIKRVTEMFGVFRHIAAHIEPAENRLYGEKK